MNRHGRNGQSHRQGDHHRRQVEHHRRPSHQPRRPTHRHRHTIAVTLVGALLLALLPTSGAGAAAIDPDDVTACNGAQGLVTFNDELGFFSATIECMAAFGITQGDADGNFRPGGPMTRAQMALFIARLVSQAESGDVTSIPPSTGPDAFDDIATSFARDAINWLAQLDITTGSAGGSSYDPSGTVTRQQMASFITRALDTLGVTLPAPSPPLAFTDTDSINASHRDNVLILHAAGVVEGAAEGWYGPSQPVTRGQMSAFVVRSIHLVDDAGAFNGMFVVSPPSTTYTVLSPTLVGLPSANVTDTRADLDPTENLLALSDGDEVTVLQFSVPDDTFLIDAAPATPALFLAELAIGASIEVASAGGGFVHDLTPAPEVVLEGTVGWALTDIVDAPSGVVLQAFWSWWEGQTYTVDGVAVSQNTFANALSPGDTIDIEVLVEDPLDFADSEFRFDLTNTPLAGQVVNVLVGSLFNVDVVADDDGVFDRGTDHTLFEIPGYAIVDNPGASADPDAIELRLDGALSTPADIGAAVSTAGFEVGGEVTYTREASQDAGVDADVTIVYTSDTTPAITTGCVSPLPDAVTPAGVINVIPGSGFAGDAIDAAGPLVTSVQVDGTLVAPGDLASMLSAGDEVVHTVAFGDTAGPLTIASSDLAGDVIGFDPTAQTINLEVVPCQPTTPYDYTTAPFGYPATVQYSIGWLAVDLATFEATIDGAPPGSDINVEVLDTGTLTQYQVTID